MPDSVQLVTLAPGHFHAALVQKEALVGVDPHVHVYGPQDDDLRAHLERIARFNSRERHPTNWTLDVHAGNDWFERFLNDRPGNAVVIAGRNRPKIDLILAAVSAGYCVLADKPWIVEAADFPKLERVFVEAERNGVYAQDVMTERFEVTTQLQRELMRDERIFGEPLTGRFDQPAMVLESVHYLVKTVDGVPLRRPAWWFDPAVAGEAMADVGTHLADLALWLTFPNEAIALADLEVLDADLWPTAVLVDDFRTMTGLPEVPDDLAHLRNGDELTYHGNGSALVRIRDRFVRLTTRWEVAATGPNGDTHLASAHGSKSTITIRHEPAFGPGPQVFVTPAPGEMARVLSAVQDVCRTWSNRCPGYVAIDLGERIHIPIPASERTGHEAHFADVMGDFVGFFRERSSLPAWEKPNLLAKYFITTQSVARARTKSINSERPLAERVG
jgi:predicted dehydrogenase